MWKDVTTVNSSAVISAQVHASVRKKEKKNQQKRSSLPSVPLPSDSEASLLPPPPVILFLRFQRHIPSGLAGGM